MKDIKIGSEVYYIGHGNIKRRVKDIQGGYALIWGAAKYVPLINLSLVYIEGEKENE